MTRDYLQEYGVPSQLPNFFFRSVTVHYHPFLGDNRIRISYGRIRYPSISLAECCVSFVRSEAVHSHPLSMIDTPTPTGIKTHQHRFPHC
jgi:hypothetical protein